MSSIETDSSNGLPGLRYVRDALGIQGKDLAEAVNITPRWLSTVETGASDCTQKLQRQIAAELFCDPVDLVGIPTEARLLQIKIAYKRHELHQLESEAS